LWLHSLKVAQLLRSAACLHTNQSRSYLNHLVSILKGELFEQCILNVLVKVIFLCKSLFSAQKSRVLDTPDVQLDLIT